MTIKANKIENAITISIIDFIISWVTKSPSIRIIVDVTANTIAWKRAIMNTLIFLDTPVTINNIKEYGMNSDNISKKSKYTKIIYVGIKIRNI